MTATQSGNGQSAANSSNKPLEFNVVASDSGGSLRYELRPTNSASAPYLKGRTIALPNGSDWYDISFHLVDNSNQKLEFDPNVPICAQIGADCPAAGSGNQTDGQLTQNSASSKRLVMINRNQDPPRQIGYTLCFIDAATNQPVEPFDPIMDNGGGGHLF